MEIFYIAIFTVVAGLVGTMTGIGISTILMPVALFFFPLPEALLLVVIVHWFGDIWKVLLFKTGIQWRLILLFGLPGFIAAFLSAQLVFVAPETLLAKILGGFFVMYPIFLLTHSSFKLPQKNSTAVSGGLISGFIIGIFGIGGEV